RDFEDIKADSIISITEKKVAESMCKEAMNKSKIHKKFEEGLKLIQTAKERYPDQKEVIQHYSYKFGIVILSEVKDLTIKKHFNQALDMLEYYEKHHFKGPMKSMRKTMANYIMELAKMSSSPREAQNLIKIAKDIEEGRSLGNNLWNWLKVNFS
ncbi:MAG: hypothetical protein KKH40_07645, partial [Nanoarchaeota archaeon]|nr:hypothetical protein [Nanoarchaeota archaeon]